ncbi:MAG: hypothetical protein WCA81_05740 [Rhizomicrobium sp.]
MLRIQTETRAFYDALPGSAGIATLFPHPSGGRVYGKDGKPFFVVLAPYDKTSATGHISRQGVGAWTRALQARAPTFYMSYFRDLDGNKLCAFCPG